jgi:hypothetical protein
MAIELVPLCTMRVQLKPPIEVGTGPTGTRVIAETESVKFDGDRFSGEMLGTASGDWVLVGPEGTGTIDVRTTFRSTGSRRSARASSTRTSPSTTSGTSSADRLELTSGAAVVRTSPPAGARPDCGR